MAIHWLAKKYIRAGVTSGASSVVHEVIVTESATSPRARKVTKFEAVPPGTQPRSIRPTAKSGGSAKALQSAKAASGMMRNCARMPTKTSLGRRKISRKSAVVSVSPMPNIMTPRRIAIQLPMGLNTSGKTKPSIPAIITHSAKVLLAKRLSISNVFIIGRLGQCVIGALPP